VTSALAALMTSVGDLTDSSDGSSTAVPGDKLFEMLRFALTEDCYLRLLEEADADELYRVIEAERTYLSRWLPWAAGQTKSGTLAFIQSTRRQLADNNGFQAALVCRDSIAGMAGFHGVSWDDRSTSIGYWLSESRQGQGTMTHAVRALTGHAFSDLELHRVEIRTAPDNQRSRAIPERLGFTLEGTLRQAERLGDRYLDSCVYSMLADEWPAVSG
jgi:ribosomal-protein-serine acetyltransferase